MKAFFLSFKFLIILDYSQKSCYYSFLRTHVGIFLAMFANPRWDTVSINCLLKLSLGFRQKLSLPGLKPQQEATI